MEILITAKEPDMINLHEIACAIRDLGYSVTVVRIVPQAGHAPGSEFFPDAEAAAEAEVCIHCGAPMIPDLLTDGTRCGDACGDSLLA